MSEDLNKMRELAAKAADIAPGAWDHDTDNNDGAYGSGPGARHGFSSYFMMDDKGRRLFDSYNSEVAEVHEDDDSAWDENSRRLFDYLAAFNPATALSLLSRLQAAEERAEKLEGAMLNVQQQCENVVFNLRQADSVSLSNKEAVTIFDRMATTLRVAALKTEGA